MAKKGYQTHLEEQSNKDKQRKVMIYIMNIKTKHYLDWLWLKKSPIKIC